MQVKIFKNIFFYNFQATKEGKSEEKLETDIGIVTNHAYIIIEVYDIKSTELLKNE